MNILHWLFNKLNPEIGTNWMSVKYAWWKYSRLDKYNAEYLKKPHVPSKIFEVAGAGKISISETPTSLTGRTVGFSFSVSWSDSGLFCGGVLGIDEARELANHILLKCNELTKTEKELVEERYKQLNFSMTNYKPTQLSP